MNKQDKTNGDYNEIANKVRKVRWHCDKKGICEAINIRTIRLGSIINDDVCDYCNRNIHEPITIEITE